MMISFLTASCDDSDEIYFAQKTPQQTSAFSLMDIKGIQFIHMAEADNDLRDNCRNAFC